MLNDAVKVAYNRGRFEMAKEILNACSIAETISAARVRALLRDFEEHEDNDEVLDGMVDVPHYVIARAHIAFNPPKHGLGTLRPSLPPLKGVPDVD